MNTEEGSVMLHIIDTFYNIEEKKKAGSDFKHVPETEESSIIIEHNTKQYLLLRQVLYFVCIHFFFFVPFKHALRICNSVNIR